MIDTRSQETISQGYIFAVAGMADATINILSRDSYSNDVSITKWVIDSNGQGFEANLHVQLKTVYSKSNYR